MLIEPFPLRKRYDAIVDRRPRGARDHHLLHPLRHRERRTFLEVVFKHLQAGGVVIAVIFEVEPHADHRDAYLAAAAELRPLLEKMDGFISVERFQSLTEPHKILSLSFWRDEESVRQWRNTDEHRRTQEAGRRFIFADYRLRVASVLRDYGMSDRDQAPDDSRNVHG